MWNFPTPLPDELIYSTIARAGLHHGIQSPKQLLDEVYQDRKVVATIDLPSHLNAVVHLLERTGCFSLIDLIYKHTIFGLYAPFVQESHRQKAITLMAEQASGSVHLMLGLNASRVPNNTKFRYCPICIQQQREIYGEYFWNRAWFLPNLSICLKHNCSLLSQDYIQQQHRHLFLPLLPNQTQDIPNPYFKEDFILGKMAVELLQLEPQPSPSYEQWTRFYLEIADAKNFRRGNHVCHEQTYEQVIKNFNIGYLRSKNLGIDPDQDTSWFRSIFRKHRKAFSFLEHCIVWSSFIPEISPKEIMQYVSSISVIPYFIKRPISTENVPPIKIREMRQKWQDIVLLHGVTSGRKIKSGQATYIWLYRNDQNWLLTFNSRHLSQPQVRKNKVNWPIRDFSITKELFKVLYRSNNDLACPRMSKSWFLNQLSKGNSISKNLHQLPLSSKFLSTYSEDTIAYQIRRITHAMIRLGYTESSTKDRWRILRLAGLSKERITQEAQIFLNMICEKKIYAH